MVLTVGCQPLTLPPQRSGTAGVAVFNAHPAGLTVPPVLSGSAARIYANVSDFTASPSDGIAPDWWRPPNRTPVSDTTASPHDLPPFFKPSSAVPDPALRHCTQ